MQNPVLQRGQKSTLVIMFSLGLLYSAPGFAQRNDACKEDITKFCKDVSAGNRAVAKCLKEHQSDLSPACKTNISEKKEKAQDFSQACKKDVAQFCKDTKTGGGRVLKCLKRNTDKLSAECKEVLPSK